MQHSPSPNFDSRDGQKVDMLVLHYTGMPSAAEALARLRDPAAKVSAHYLVDEDGTIHQLVDESARAWHAGVANWRGNTNINQRSIGIEIVNPGHEFGYRHFPKAQMEAVAKLTKDIAARHQIPSWNVVAHSDIAPTRKTDPGELFDWKLLAGVGVGIMPDERPALVQWIEAPVKWVARLFSGSEILSPGMQGGAVGVLQAKLHKIGYGIDITGDYDLPTTQVVQAFQRHFRPGRVDGLWDAECGFALEGLLKRVPAVTTPQPDGRMTAL